MHLPAVVVLWAFLGVIVTLIFHSVHQLSVSMEAIALKVMVLQLHVFAHKELMEQVVVRAICGEEVKLQLAFAHEGSPT